MVEKSSSTESFVVVEKETRDAGTQTEFSEEEPEDLPTWTVREARAQRAGEQAKAKLQGRISHVAKTPALAGVPRENRIYVLIQGAPGCTDAGFAKRIAILDRHIKQDGVTHSQSIFHSWASAREAKVYWSAVFGDGVEAPTLSEICEKQ